jgi:hypothetical protein
LAETITPGCLSLFRKTPALSWAFLKALFAFEPRDTIEPKQFTVGNYFLARRALTWPIFLFDNKIGNAK